MRILDKIMHGPEQPELTSFLQEFTEEKSAFYRREELIETFDAFCKRQDKPEAFRSNSLIRHLLDYLQEMVLFEGDAYLVTRRRIGVTEIQRIAPAGDRLREHHGGGIPQGQRGHHPREEAPPT